MKIPASRLTLASVFLLSLTAGDGFSQGGGEACAITRQSVDSSTCPGEPVQVHIEFSGQPKAVQWFRDGVVIATQDLPPGGAATLNAPPRLLAADGSYREAVYRAVLLCPGESIQSEPATVTPSSVKWGVFDTSLGGTARLTSPLGGGLPVVRITGGGSAVFDLAGASSAQLDFSAATVAALSNTDAEGEILISSHAAAQRKGWDGTVKGRTTEITLRKRPGRSRFSNGRKLTLRCDGPGGGPRFCLFNGTTLAAQLDCGPECLLP